MRGVRLGSVIVLIIGACGGGGSNDAVPAPLDLAQRSDGPDLYFDPAQCGPPPDFAFVATCSDGIKDQDETDVDCGGAKCPKCADGAMCSAAADCKSAICANGRCIGCSDGVKNQDETDVDCGGQRCTACHFGKACLVAGDCVSGLCTMGKCAMPVSCSDGKYDGQETDVDCGGPCAPCPTDKHCLTRADCLNDPCSMNVCTGCNDGLVDGDETDVDCGGSCLGCADLKFCYVDSDCAGGHCASDAYHEYKWCESRGCYDGRLDGDETDVDCGGACMRCRTCRRCRVDDDCYSEHCVGGWCADNCANPAQSGGGDREGLYCNGWNACDSRSCPGCCDFGDCFYGFNVPSPPGGMEYCTGVRQTECSTTDHGDRRVCTPTGWIGWCSWYTCGGCCNAGQCITKDLNAACGETCTICPMGTQCAGGRCQPL